jgi:hypothetical protein
MERTMSKRANLAVIIGLICLLLVSTYFWEKRYQTLKAEVKTFIESNQEQSRDLQERFSKLCARLSKMEESHKQNPVSKIPFTIAQDDG